jgi:hypothetical protein
MKNIILLTVGLFVAGCALPVFDENELLLAAKIESEAQIMLENEACKDSKNYPNMVHTLTFYSETWRNYSEHMANEEIRKLSKEIDSLVDEWKERLLTGASGTFCKFKLENIRDAASRATKAMAERRRQ